MKTDSQDKFLEYYALASESDETRQRFENNRRAVLSVMDLNNESQSVFDVVDVGCGAGTQSMIWARDGHRVSAVDINEGLVDLGRQRALQAGLKIKFFVGSAIDMPLTDSSADIVLVPELLEHVQDWEAVLDECTRIIRPGGYLYVSTTNRMCPVQREYHLPLYSWYPRCLQKICEEKARTTKPEWVNHAPYPAVSWFTPYGLAKALGKRGYTDTFDRFDLKGLRQEEGSESYALRLIQWISPLRWMAHVFTPYTVLVAKKRNLPD